MSGRDRITDPGPGDRWVVVVAHPDDETFGCGSLIAHAARRGAQVTVICATRGEAGERTPAITPDADLGQVREAELFAAARMLGAAGVELLDYADSGFDGSLPGQALCGAPVDELAASLAARIDELAADVLVVTDVIDHPELLELRDRAIAAHRSQRSPYDDLSPDLRRRFLARTYLIRVG